MKMGGPNLQIGAYNLTENIYAKNWIIMKEYSNHFAYI